jgi:predicted RecB family endonuclease
VREQYHFSPSGVTEEIEDYRVELEDVVALEVTIVANISGGDAYASLAELRLAGSGE